MKRILFAMTALALVFGLSMPMVGCAPADEFDGMALGGDADILAGGDEGCPCGPLTVDLLAGQHILVGSVTVTNTYDQICVTYEVDEPWLIYETHLWIGDTEPKGGLGTYPYGDDELDGVASWAICVDFAVLDVAIDDCLYIAAHAVVAKGVDEEGDLIDEETAWGEGTPGSNMPGWGMYFRYGVCEPENGGPHDLCWHGETAWADGDRYVAKGNWATYTPYEPDTEVMLYAGQTMEAGTVYFSDPDDGWVIITITLNEGWRFAPAEEGEEDPENVKIQDYADEPEGNPSPGLFDWKGYAEGPDFSMTVPENNFYGVHVDVEWEGPCDEPEE